ncbi:hypothetical protein [Moheibacter stercoris]|uniref:Plastocyanin domain-containing protein n=1 Tax=Moheibacter stercoris TaxID=1628251 RepID=A0ABV2LRC4_9FLAO
MDTISIVVTLICLVILGLVTYWFVNRKNSTKISSQREIIEEGKKPDPEELEDPMNP